MKKKVLMAVGGTGGHIYPALSLAKQLNNKASDIEVHFIGGHLEKNRYFADQPFPLYSISCGSFVSKNPLHLLKNVYYIFKGILQTRAVIKKLQPDLMIGFGSYHTFPALLGAKFNGIQLILHESNSIPGKVNRLISPFARLTAVFFPNSATFLKGKTAEVALPLRPGYKKGAITRKEALQYFGLGDGKTTLLIFGGSQGARALNKLALDAISSDLQVIHILGKGANLKEIEQSYSEKGIKSSIKEFEDRMDIAWQAADFALCRAGSGTIAEALEFEVPCLFIPYPFAAENHQELNAGFFVNTIGGGWSFREKNITSKILSQAFQALLQGNQLEEMRKAILVYKANRQQKDFYTLISEILEKDCI